MNQKLSKNYDFIVYAKNIGYSIINGEIISHKNKKIKLFKNPNGYYYFSIRKRKIDDEKKTRYTILVHKFLAYEKFGDKIFEPGIVVRHLNGNPLDNSWENIGIGTQKDNMMDKNPSDRLKYSLNAASKLRKFTDEQIELIKIDYLIHKMKYSEIMKKWNISSKGTLSYIINNKYKTVK